jgi:hypothetical protein
LEAAERERRLGVVAIVACEEFQWVISARNRASKPKAVCFEFFKEERRVGVYYVYVLDRDVGPGFIKICTYIPYPAKVCVNGHEWAKRQADRAGVHYTALSGPDPVHHGRPQRGLLVAALDAPGRGVTHPGH